MHICPPSSRKQFVDPAASVYRGAFDLPAGAEGAAITLVLRSVGETQSVYVNGHALAQNLKFDPVGYAFTLDKSLLHPGRNVVTLFTTRFTEPGKKFFQWNGPGPAAVQLVTPPAPWKRSVFNGLAQVIVQSKQEPGEIELTATSPSLSPASVNINSQSMQPIPKIE